MVKKQIAWFAKICLFFLVSLPGCGYDGPTMSTKELKYAIEEPGQKIVVIDVRPSTMYEKGHVPGAINYPLEHLSKKISDIKAIDKPIAVICICGKKALMAVKRLAGQHIETTLVVGGMKKWQAAQYPLEKGVFNNE